MFTFLDDPRIYGLSVELPKTSSMDTALPTKGIATRQVFPTAKQRNDIPFGGACLPSQLCYL
jgi:hypothetical protein